MRWAAFSMSLLLLCVCLRAPAKAQDPITVRGKLVNIMEMGGESTGWAIELDSDFSVDGKTVESIELDGLTRKAEKLQDKHVEVVGKLSHRHGAERGDWPVLEVVSIKQVKS